MSSSREERPRGRPPGLAAGTRELIRHLLVDSLGMILTVLVTPANVQDRDGGQLLLEQTKVVLSRLRAIYADMAYNGSFKCEHIMRICPQL